MAKWKCSVCGTVVDGRGKRGHARIKDGKHDGEVEVAYTKVEAENETKDKDNINVVGDSGIKKLPDEPNELKTEVQPNTKNEMNSIQIIDSNTGKKEKGIVDQIFEKAFSEEFEPITTSLLGALVARLQQPNNATEEGILTAEDGSKHAMI